MGFSGYSRDIQNYYKELNANNNKDWFDANRARFDETVIRPSQDLIETIAPRLARLSPPLNSEPKINGSIRRVYRDIRFSKDKTPYNTYLHLIFWAGHGKPNQSPGVHIILGAQSFGFGAGQWGLTPEQLTRYRADVMSDGGKAVSRAVKGSLHDGATLDEPALKRVPRGFDGEAAGADWLRYKGLIVRRDHSNYPDALFSVAGADLVVDFCSGMSSLNNYLMQKINTE